MPLQKYCLELIFLWKCLLMFTVYRINTSICHDHVLLCTLSPLFLPGKRTPDIDKVQRAGPHTWGSISQGAWRISAPFYTLLLHIQSHYKAHPLPETKNQGHASETVGKFYCLFWYFFLGGGVNCFFYKHLIYMKCICLFKFIIQVENSSLTLSKFWNFKVNNIFF